MASDSARDCAHRRRADGAALAARPARPARPVPWLHSRAHQAACRTRAALLPDVAGDRGFNRASADGRGRCARRANAAGSVMYVTPSARDTLSDAAAIYGLRNGESCDSSRCIRHPPGPLVENRNPDMANPPKRRGLHIRRCRGKTVTGVSTTTIPQIADFRKPLFLPRDNCARSEPLRRRCRVYDGELAP